jgi:hypothetical protein
MGEVSALLGAPGVLAARVRSRGYGKPVTRRFYGTAAQGAVVGHRDVFSRLVLQHPVSHQIRLGEGRIRDSAKGMLVKLEDELHSDAYAAALECGRELEMDEVIIELVGPNS